MVDKARTTPRSEDDKAKRAERIAFAEKQSDEDFVWLLSDKRGRRYMWELLSECNVFANCFTGNSQTFFNEGKRDAGLRQLNRINRLCPERYFEMAREAQQANEVIENG